MSFLCPRSGDAGWGRRRPACPLAAFWYAGGMKKLLLTLVCGIAGTCAGMAIGSLDAVESPATNGIGHVDAAQTASNTFAAASDLCTADEVFSDRAWRAEVERAATPMIEGVEESARVPTRGNDDSAFGFMEPRRGETPAVLDAASIAQTAMDAVVAVNSHSLCGRCSLWHVRGSATGFVVNRNGLVVTNHHVVDGDAVRTIALKTGRVLRVTEVIRSDPQTDLALIRVDIGDTPLPAALPVAPKAAIGTPVAAIHHPDGAMWTLTTGVISRFAEVNARGGAIERMQISAPYARGSSGGPILDSRGAVVGVVIATRSIYYEQEEQRNLQMVLNLCASSDQLRDLLSGGD